MKWKSIVGILVVFVIPLILSGPKPLSQSNPQTLHLMPPHPNLRDGIKSGKVKLPRFMTDPELAQKEGVDSPGQGNLSIQKLTGIIHVLAVAVDFSDQVHTVTASAFNNLLFAAPVPGFGSVRDYFNEISYAQVDIVSLNLPGSLGWIRAPSSYASYVKGSYCTDDDKYPNNCQKLAEDVVDAINGVVNFSQYDNNNDGVTEPIIIIHAGRGAELSASANDIWSHSWSLKYPRHYDGVTIGDYTIQPEYWSTKSSSTTDMTIGVFAHEMGHGFWNLPDLYDRTNKSEGIGKYDLMSSGSWNGPKDMGAVPAWPSAWSRIQMGFALPTLIISNVTNRSLPQPYDLSAADPILKLTSPLLHSPEEYYLLENRQRAVGHYDAYLPADGLFIWHIDESMNVYNKQNDYPCTQFPDSGCPDSHYLVALEQADALLGLENGYDRGNSGDAFPGSSNNRRFTNLTYPGSSSWYAPGSTGISVTNIGDSSPTMTMNIFTTAISDPIGSPDEYQTNEDQSLSIINPGVLVNDLGSSGNPFTAIPYSQPAHGTLALNPDGSFTYTPEPDWNGTDSFKYIIQDGSKESDPVTVKITVIAVNDPPMAFDDSFAFILVQPPFLLNLLSNDIDIEGDPLSALILSSPSHGSLIPMPDGNFSYTPLDGWFGTDYFTYSAFDGAANSNTATVKITVGSQIFLPLAMK